MVYTETSALDKAERGECQENGGHKEDATSQANGDIVQRALESTPQTQAPVTYAQGDDVGERYTSPYNQLLQLILHI